MIDCRFKDLERKQPCHEAFEKKTTIFHTPSPPNILRTPCPNGISSASSKAPLAHEVVPWLILSNL
jgi:hypothetical protein